MEEYIINIIINSDNYNQRIDKFLIKTYKHLPYSFICKCLRKGIIKLNKKKINNDYQLKVDDIISIFLKNEVIFNSIKIDTGDFEILSKEMSNIPIIYEDENILLVNKPSGMIVHEDKYNKRYNLINIIKAYLYKCNIYNPYDTMSFVPSLCNRIDRNTCGIVLIAKNFKSLKILNESIKLNYIKKKYISIIIGKPNKNKITISNYLYKNEKTNKVSVKDIKDFGAKKAITKLKLLNSNNNLSVIECELITGRTHQIRVHLSNLGFPILGDGKYGIDFINKKYGIFYQCLCSYSIQFDFNNYDIKNHLYYLNNKIFSINIKNISFIQKFFNKEYL